MASSSSSTKEKDKAPKRKPVDLYNEKGSVRYNHFQSALQLAVQRATHKWSFDDFSECFPLYSKEDKVSATATFTSIADFMEAQVTRDLNKVFEDYDVHDSIDILHQLIEDSKRRKAEGYAEKDVWTSEAGPEHLISAHTAPVLENELERLRVKLAKMEAQNLELVAKIQDNVTVEDQANANSIEILEKIDTALAAWEEIPREDIQTWTLQTFETTAFPPVV